jgi:serine/threonine protein kinase
VHLDIKSANVLLQDATFAVAKLADLGVSKYLVQGSLLNLTRVAGARMLCQSPPVECLPGCTCIVNGRRPDVTRGVPAAVPAQAAHATGMVNADPSVAFSALLANLFRCEGACQ